MMTYLNGKVLYHGQGYLIIERGGIGYRVSFPEPVAHDFRGDVEVYLHEVIRDNERELFGFSSIDQLELFWKLISISGVGPKIAQKIVFSHSVEQVRANIMKGDLQMLTNVSGVGKKTAQKIILELKGALTDDEPVAAIDSDAVDALVGLGYKKQDAQVAIAAAPGETTEELIKAALKGLGM
jgi:holliday junction DNA helicase RuvA